MNRRNFLKPSLGIVAIVAAPVCAVAAERVIGSIGHRGANKSPKAFNDSFGSSVIAREPHLFAQHEKNKLYKSIVDSMNNVKAGNIFNDYIPGKLKNA